MNGKKSAAGNSYPIVLVHGMLGWGRDEMLGKFHYWGGFGDIQQDLTNRGYPTYTASVGPLSSNWDRAVELYYCIKGGQVDYGAVHSSKYGHARYGRSYPGLYPEWDENHPVHLIGHSMGGPTPRYLIELLENGDPEEIAYAPDGGEAPTSDLFKGGRKGWVHSFTSIAGVHDGAIPADDSEEFLRLIKEAFYQFAAVAGIASSEPIYDFNLQQWGLERDRGQSFDDYMKQVMTSRIWHTTDMCIYDLSTIAARNQNALCRTSPDIYYFTYAVDGTEAGPGGVRVPLRDMSSLIKADSARIGANKRDLPRGYEAWRYNDGLVSVPAAQYPTGHPYEFLDPAKPIEPKKGIWYVNPTLTGKDHLSIVVPGCGTTIDELYAFYESLAKNARSLPA